MPTAPKRKIAATLVVAHHAEDLGWLRHVDREAYDAVVVVTKASGPEPPSGLRDVPDARVIRQPANLGFEASAFLEFVVREYDRFPDVAVFVHGHRRSWHHDGDADDLVNALAAAAGPGWAAAPAYRNVNCHCGEAEHADLRELAAAGVDVARTDERASRCCCAQFLVRRAAVLRHPPAVYRALLGAVYADGSKEQATRMEHAWLKLWTGRDDELALRAGDGF